MKYCQCKLENPTLLSNDKFKITLKLVSFIPEKFAIKDKIIKLKNEKGDWEEGWVS